MPLSLLRYSGMVFELITFNSIIWDVTSLVIWVANVARSELTSLECKLSRKWKERGVDKTHPGDWSSVLVTNTILPNSSGLALDDFKALSTVETASSVPSLKVN